MSIQKRTTKRVGTVYESVCAADSSPPSSTVTERLRERFLRRAGELP